jgi:hypothetical protein
MMWQKVKGKYHLLWNFSPDVQDGRFLQTACHDMVQARKKNQVSYVSYGGHMCETCKGIWHINCTSVDDARHSIRDQANLKVLRRALELADRKTLRQALQSRISRLEKAGKR